MNVGNQQREVILKAPGPRLAGLERTDQWVTAVPSVSAGMTVGGVIATPDLAALQADTQMQPRVPRGQALLATIHRLGQLRDLDVIEVSAGGHLSHQA